MATATRARWTVVVSKETDADLRGYLAREKATSSEALSEFVEEAVNMRLLDLNIQKIRAAFSDLSSKEIEGLVEEAVAWARSSEGRACE